MVHGGWIRWLNETARGPNLAEDLDQHLLGHGLLHRQHRCAVVGKSCSGQRLGIERSRIQVPKLQDKSSEVIKGKLCVDRHALWQCSNEGIDRQRVDLGLCTFNERAKELVLTVNATKVACSVILGHAVHVVLIVTTSSHRQGLNSGQRLAASRVDSKPGVVVSRGIGELQFDATESVHRINQASEGHDDNMVDLNAEVRFDGSNK